MEGVFEDEFQEIIRQRTGGTVEPEAPVTPPSEPQNPDPVEDSTTQVVDDPDTPSEEPATQQEPEPEPYWKLASRKLGEEVADEGEFIKKVSGYREKAVQDPFEGDEFLKRLADYRKKGGDPKFFIETQMLDLDKMAKDNPDDLLFLDYKLKEGDVLTDAQIRKLIQNEFKTDTSSFDITEDEAEMNQIRKVRAIKEAKARLNEWKVQSAEPPAERERRNQEAQLEAQAARYQERLKSLSKDVDFDVDGNKYKLSVRDTDMKAAENPGEFMKQFLTNGEWDPAKIKRANFLINGGYADIVKASAPELAGQEVKKVVQKVDNPFPKGSEKPMGGGSKDSYLDMLLREAELKFGKPKK